MSKSLHRPRPPSTFVSIYYPLLPSQCFNRAHISYTNRPHLLARGWHLCCQQKTHFQSFFHGLLSIIFPCCVSVFVLRSFFIHPLPPPWFLCVLVQAFIRLLRAGSVATRDDWVERLKERASGTLANRKKAGEKVVHTSL